MPLTQNGFVRILANPRYRRTVMYRPAELLDHLRQFCAQQTSRLLAGLGVADGHEDSSTPAVIRGYRQVSDIYLLGLARKMGGYLATFDAGIPLSAVIGATRDTLAVISDGNSDE